MIRLFLGDSREVLKTLESNTIDSVVTDPPYELGFMANKWDSSGIAYNVELWREVLRVLKPGGHLLSFGGTRTYHRMVCAIEDAGFEIRDQMQWIYGQGFPKSLNIGKATNDTKWTGWGTALKPTNEPIVVARKPIIESTVAKNVLKWGTGGLNIDACRIELNGEIVPINKLEAWSGFGQEIRPEYRQEINTMGRFPANTMFDEEAGKLLDEQSGITKSRASEANFEKSNNENTTHILTNIKSGVHFSDMGGASRFFYCPKANKKERNLGLEELSKTTVDDGRDKSTDTPFLRGRLERHNIHPTVKPVELMSYLCRLVTPPDGIVLDPFLGSGSTGVAALNENFNFIGIELNEDYLNIAKTRIEGAVGGIIREVE